MKLVAMFTLAVATSWLMGCSEDTPTFSSLQEEKTFIQSSNEGINTKIDILWIIDNSGSMETSQQNLVDNFESFISKFIQNNYDFRIAITTTDAWRADFDKPDSYAYFRDGKGSNHSGVFIITPETPNIIDTFLTNATQGIGGTGDERALQSMQIALESPFNAGFVREDSFFSIVIVSDEDDFSHGSGDFAGDDYNYVGTAGPLHPVSNYLTYLENLTGTSGPTRRFSVSGMGIWDQACYDELTDDWPGRKIGIRHGELIDATEGIKGNLCGNFADDLQLISSQIIQLSTQFYLDRTPKVETIKVYVNGSLVPHIDSNPGPKSGGWAYNADANSILFYLDYTPEQGSVINVNFDTATLEN